MDVSREIGEMMMRGISHTSVGHGEAAHKVLDLEVLVIKSVAVDRLATGAVQ